MGTSTAYPTPRSRGSGGPLSAQWSDATRKALAGPGDVPVPVGIDTYTWAELQAAYPNNGAALLALPANTMAFVSDWQTFFVRNTAGTYWRSVGSVGLAFNAAAGTPHTGTTADTIVASYAIPAGLVTPKTTLRWRSKVTRAQGSGVALNNSQGWTRLYINTSNSLSGATALCALRFSSTNDTGDLDIAVMMRDALNSQIAHNWIESWGSTQTTGGSFRTSTVDCANAFWLLAAFMLSDAGHIYTIQAASLDMVSY